MYSNLMQDKLLESYKRIINYATDAIQHYELFMDHMMPYIIREYSRIEVPAENNEKHIVHLKNVVVKKPSIFENDFTSSKTGVIEKLLPKEARERGLTYSCHVFVDIEHKVVGNNKNTVTVYREVPLFDMPVMLRSKYCHLSTDSSEECFMDYGGYYIIRGNAKVIQPQKVQRINVHLVKGSKHGDIDMDIRSLRSDEKFRSSSTLYMHLGGSPPMMTVDIPFLKSNLNVLCLFRFLGLHTKEEIESALQFDKEDKRRLFSYNFGHPFLSCDFDEILDAAGTSLNLGADATQEKIRKQVMQQINGELLPHLGYDDSAQTKLKKLVYLRIIIFKMLDVYLGYSDPDDRDFEGYKSVQMSAGILSVMFRQQFAGMMKMLRNRVYDRSKKGKHLNVASLLTESLTRDILKAFSEGEVTVQKDSSNAGTSVIQMAQQINPLGIQTHIQRVSTALPRDGKYKQLRGVDPTQLFVFCPTETPEGHGCGLLQNLASFARVRMGQPLHFVTNAVMSLNELEENTIFPLESMNNLEHRLVLVNSDIVGYTLNEERFIEIARNARRNQILPFDCSIVRVEHGISISCDMGVVVFPLFFLRNFHVALQIMNQNNEEEIFSTLCRSGCIDYIDAHELLEYKVAFDSKELVEGHNFSHMAVHPCSFMGTSASSVPFANHDQAPRVAYQAGMVKQAISTPATNHKERTDLGYVYDLWYPQRPMSETAISRSVKMNEYPMGENLIIAIAPYGGWSQEDSIIRSKASVDRGSGRVTVYRVFKGVCRKRGTHDGEQFEHPFHKDPEGPKCEGIRANVNYDKIGFDGMPEEGTPMKNGDVLIGRVLHATEIVVPENPMMPTTTRACRRDRSIVLTCEPTERYVVDKVVFSTTKEGYRSVRVKLRSIRIPQEGDKISSRHGQKGTIGILLDEEDMPFVMSGPNAGMKPDAIINVHSINGRMTIGKLLEMLFSSLGVVRGEFVDATPFRHVNAKWAMDELLKQGYGTEETMIDGCSGMMMNRPWFIGSCFYQTLKHMVLDKITVRQRGQRAILTRQPLDGRANQGGQRMGEMEKDAFLAHGAAYSLDDRSRIASDAHSALVCSKCGQIGDTKFESLSDLTECKKADEHCNLCEGIMVSMPTTYCYARLLAPELATCGVKIIHNFEGLEEENKMFLDT